MRIYKAQRVDGVQEEGIEYVRGGIVNQLRVTKEKSMPQKTIFIGHPIGGDIQANVKKVLKICAELHTKGIIPVAPYLVSLQYLNDEVAEDRELGMEANHECFRRHYIDELWLFGERISSGMRKEVLLAKEMDIPVIPKTEGTKRDLEELETELIRQK
jgi:hypothetical protein